MISFLDAHVHMFNWLGGVSGKLAYDNLKTAVVICPREYANGSQHAGGH
jgi:transposase